MKFSKGKIKFKGKKGGDYVPTFWGNMDRSGIPSEKIIHGGTGLSKSYDTEFAEIVDFHNEYYIVKFPSNNGRYTQLGFKEEQLENIEVMEEFKVGDWIEITTQHPDAMNINDSMKKKHGMIFQITSMSDNGVKFDGCDNWTWRFEDNHFKRAEAPVKANFQKDSYIVITPSQKDSSFPRDFCFKQRQTDTYLLPYLDAGGSTDNGWNIFEAKSRTNWRPATLKEVVEYDRLGKPYDVTKIGEKVNDELGVKAGDWIEFNNSGGLYSGKLIINRSYQLINREEANKTDHDWILEDKNKNRIKVRLKGKYYPCDTYWEKVLVEVKKSLKGRYLKALESRVEGISGSEIGDLFLITDDECYNSIKDKNNKSWVYTPNQIGTKWELMPEGFKPDIKVEETKIKFEVGDIVVGNKKAGINYAVTGTGTKLRVTEVGNECFMGEIVNNISRGSFGSLRYDCFDLQVTNEGDFGTVIVDNSSEWVSVSPQQIRETFINVAEMEIKQAVHLQKPRILNI